MDKIERLERIYSEFTMAFAEDLPVMISFRTAIKELKEKKEITHIPFKTNECPDCIQRKLDTEPIANLILFKIAGVFNITVANIKSKSRNPDYVSARDLACFIFYKELKYSLKKTGVYVSRDHATVYCALKRTDQKIRSDKSFRDKKEDVYLYLPEIIKL